jgi:CDP-diacylglycerol--glycerol-3-phosphate 3-phosphatidyltransferase
VTWPNKITYSRIVFIPLFVLAALEVRSHAAYKFVALGLFAAMALGDLFDGYIARKFNLTSPEGKFIDPLADKLLMTTACVFLALPIWMMPNGEPPLLPEVAVVIIARDVLIVVWVLAAFLAGAKRVYEASILGRVTTFVQMSMTGATLAGTIWLGVHRYAAVPLSYVAVVFTITSGLHYLYKYAKTISFHGSGAE